MKKLVTSFILLLTLVLGLFACQTEAKYNLLVTSNDTTMGEVSGGGEFLADADVTVTATPKTGYEFVGWFEGTTEKGTDASYSFKMPANDLELVGKFQAESDPVVTYTISIVSNDTNMGTVNDVSGSYQAGATIDLVATAKTGYRFVGWYDGANVLSASASYTYTVVGNKTITAKFEDDSVPITKYSLAFSAGTGGSVSGKVDGAAATSGNSYNQNSSVELTAVANSGYELDGWYLDGTKVSGVAGLVYSFLLSKNVSIEVRFKEVSTPSSQAIIIYEVYGGGGNTGALFKNDFVVLRNLTNEAISLVGYSLQYTSAGGNFSAVNELTGSIAANGYYLVKLGTNENTSNGADLPTPNDTFLSVAVSGTTGKVALSNGKTAITGSTDASVVDFVGWGLGSESKPINDWFNKGVEGVTQAPATSNLLSIIRKEAYATAPSNNHGEQFETHTPTLSYLLTKHTLTVESNNNDFGTVNAVSGEYTINTKVDLVATPASGYRFLGWFEGETKLAETLTFNYTVSKDVTITAKFELIPTFSLTFTADGGGSISGTIAGEAATSGNSYETGAVVLTASHTDAYRFLGFYVDDTKVGVDGELTYSFDLVANISVVAKFELIPTYSLTFTSVGDGSISGTIAGEAATSGNSYQAGAVVLTASPNSGHRVEGWYLGENKIDGEEGLTYSFNLSQDISVTVKFVTSTVSYELVFSGDNGSTVTATVDGTNATSGNSHLDGSAVVLTATLPSGYRLIGWYNGETKVDGENELTYSFNLVADTTITAKFELIPTYTLSFASNGNGTVTAKVNDSDVLTDLSHNEGSAVVLTSAPDSGYRLLGWYIDDTKLDNENGLTYSFNLTANISVVAKFELIPTYSLTFTAGEGGSVSATIDGSAATSGNSYPTGAVVITAVESDGYVFDGWYISDVKQADKSGLTYDLTLSANFAVEARFLKLAPKGIIIYDIFGQGGSSTAYAKDYVVLYNTTNEAINLEGYVLHYTNAVNDFVFQPESDDYHTFVRLTGTIASKGYFLISISNVVNPSGTAFPVSADLHADKMNIGGADGNVALVYYGDTTNPISGPTDYRVSDFVGYGASPMSFGNLGAVDSLEKKYSAKRNNFNLSTNNSTDFTVGTPDLSYLLGPALTAPEVEVLSDGSISWEAITNASKYLIYVDGAKVDETTSLSYTYVPTAVGNYAVTVIAAGNKNADSAASNAISVAGVDTYVTMKSNILANVDLVVLLADVGGQTIVVKDNGVDRETTLALLKPIKAVEGGYEGLELKVVLNLNGYDITKDLYIGNEIGGNYYGSLDLSITNTHKTKVSTIGDQEDDYWWYALALDYCNDGITLNLSNITTKSNSALYTNGVGSGATLNADNCNFISSADSFTYLAGDHTYNFEDCSFKGHDGIYIKSGTHVYTNCTFEATGPKVDPKYNGNGGEGTGSAVNIDSCHGYQPTLDVTFDGATFISANGYAIYEYKTQNAGTHDGYATVVLKGEIVARQHIVSDNDVITDTDATYKYYLLDINYIAGAGTVTGAGAYEVSEPVLLNIINVNTGYRFVGWYLNGEKTTEALSTSYIMTATNTILEARFELLSYAVTYEAAVNGSYTVNGNAPVNGNVDHFTDLVLVATPADGYAFSKWVINGVDYENASHTVSVSEILSISVEFVAQQNVTLTIQVENGTADKATGQYLSGTEITITAAPATGEARYRFLGWFSGSEKIGSNLALVYPVTSNDATLVAKFVQIVNVEFSSTAEVTYKVGEENFVAGDYAVGETIVVTIGYANSLRLNNITGDGLSLVGNVLTITVQNEDMVVLVSFTQLYQLSITSTDGGFVAATDSSEASEYSGGWFAAGEDIEFYAHAATGYTFDGFYDSEDVKIVSSAVDGNKYSDKIGSANVSVRAKFSEIQAIKKFDFNFGTAAQNGYGVQDSKGNILNLIITNLVDNAQFTITGNPKLGSQITTSTTAPHSSAGAFLVLAPKSGNTSYEAVFEIDLDSDITKVVFDLAPWSSADYGRYSASLSNAELHYKDSNGDWVIAKSFISDFVNGSYKNIITELSTSASSFRFYAKANKSADVRVAIDNLQFWGL